MTRISFAVTVALFLAASSCEKENASESTATPAASVASSSGATPSVASSAAAAPNEAENLPVTADFEEEAEKTITKSNYKAELDAIEAELKKGSAP